MNDEIRQISEQIVELKKQLSGARRKQEPEAVGEYSFKTHDDGTVTLSELFGDREDLIVVHNMGSTCQHCTLWADGFTGYLPHLDDRAEFVVISPDPPNVQKPFYDSRGWNFKMVSADGSTFVEDMGYVIDGGFWPGLSAFYKTSDGDVVRTGRDFFGPDDDYCPPFRMFDLLKDGSNGWDPQFRYD